MNTIYDGDGFELDPHVDPDFVNGAQIVACVVLAEATTVRILRSVKDPGLRLIRIDFADDWESGFVIIPFLDSSFFAHTVTMFRGALGQYLTEHWVELRRSRAAGLPLGPCPEVPWSEIKSVDVYVTPTGGRYHRIPDCRQIKTRHLSQVMPVRVARNDLDLVRCQTCCGTEVDGRLVAPVDRLS